MTDSGFDLGLGDARQAGVFFVTSEDLDSLAAAGRDAALGVRRVDLSGCENKASLMLRLATQLDFPDSTGRNWDALSDNLRDLSWLPAPGYVLLLDQGAELRRRDEAVFDTLLDVLDEAAQFWAGQDVPFWAFLALDEDDFEELDAQGP
ncbi:barstar family protein [Pseudoxanthomonas beigongshangi]